MVPLQHLDAFAELEDSVSFLCVVRETTCDGILALVREPKIITVSVIFMNGTINPRLFT